MAKDTMPDLSTFRNIGVIAHIDAGKTTTTEHLLYYSGAKHRLGGVDEGTTETDYDPEEQERGITIYSACIPLRWRDHTINLIDTPGHVDFTAEVERSLRVLDGAVVVFDAQKGVEAQSETVWRQADRYNVPRLVFINKMDVVGANYAAALEQIREELECRPVPIFMPIGAGSPKDSTTPFRGVIDLLTLQALRFDPADGGKTIHVEEIPEELLEEARARRQHLFDVLTENDENDRITSTLLEEKEPDLDAVKALIREQTIKRLIQPVLCGSGREHAGIQPLLDAVTAYLPSPLDRPPVTGTHPKKPEKIERRKPDPKEPFAALVFKVVADTHGEAAFLRIYSGSLKVNSRQYNPGKDCKELIGKLFHIHADPKTGRQEVSEAYAGDIVATIGLKESVTGDTLCETQHPILLERITFAEAVVSRTVEPESSADKQKLADTLRSLQREDPTFLVKIDPDSGQTLMSGMGMLHLEVKQHRMERDFKLKIRVGKPRVSFRETIKRAITVVGEFNRQTGETRQFASLKVAFEPLEGNHPVQVVNKLKPDTVLPPFQAAAERGLKDSLQSGNFGYPVLSVKATIIDADQDLASSTEPAFEAAAALAVRQALTDNMVLLEPIMAVEVDTPEEFFGAISSDVMARRGELGDSDIRGNRRVIRAKIALSRLFDYADKLRSLSQGRASSTMAPDSYAPASAEVLRELLGE